MHIVNTATIWIDREKRYQTLDGFGVNINAKYWDGGKLRPVVDCLIDDLGAVLFRVDGYGKANWPDPDSTRGEESLCAENLERIYQTPPFQNMLGLCKYLNERNISPYITVSGVVPAWMCEADGVTLSRFDLFAKMTVHYAAWLRKNGVRFSLFGPLNETDFGPPEGPCVSPECYVAACLAVLDELDRAGMQDVTLVVPEQGGFDLRYLQALLANDRLRSRIAVVGMHMYSEVDVAQAVDYVSAHAPHSRYWMTEFGDLDQNSAKEEQLALTCLRRLFRQLQSGANGALFWDAFDNHHDHDNCFTAYGLMTSGMEVYTPKKRYYALKHIFRYVRPGFQRIAVSSDHPDLELVAFCNPDSDEITVVGINPTNDGVYLDLNLGWFAPGDGLKYLQFEAYRTCAHECCAKVTQPIIKLRNPAGKGFEFTALPHSIFTVTNIRS